MFYGNESSGEVMGLLTFLDEKFAITHHLDENNVKTLQVLPGIKKLDSGFVGEKRVALKKVTNSVPGETQLAIVELVSEINEHQFEINLPTTLYPIYGSKCEIMTILNKNTNSDELTSRNNFVFGSDTKILHEVRIILWNYRECKRYIRGLKENQGDIQNRNHCALITAGNPVICNGQVTGIVNDPETQCQPHKPRICTNVFQLLD
ncbi:snake venom serine protease homolog 2-like [Glossina fuscipes fuscipes]